jgi:hypothetical protein
MRRLLALALVVLIALAGAVPAAEAGAAGDVVLGLAAFAVFTHLLGVAAYAYAPPPQPAVVYAPPVYYARRPPPAIVRVVHYPHGRYELYGDGITTAYQWVWIPAPPPPAPPPPVLPPAR